MWKALGLKTFLLDQNVVKAKVKMVKIWKEGVEMPIKCLRQVNEG